MFIVLRRIIKSGWLGFRRNSGLSAAAIFITVLVISLATFLFLFRGASQAVVKNLEEKVDMYIYFNEELSSNDLLEIQDELSKISEIRNIEYVSKEEALRNFISRHKDDEALMESLKELGKNPLLASLNVRAWEAFQYAAISNFLTNSSFNNLIAKIDYQEKKSVIERLDSIIFNMNRAGIILGIILAVVAILVIFNTVRLTIYNSQEEIETMRLVGASNGFIRGPFMVQGIIVGFLSSIITILIFGVSLFFLSPNLKFLLPGFDMFHYFISNLAIIFSIQLASGVGLGLLSGWIAIRKYLRV
ncbi:MAG: permease-like cell division protein FtsX [bacterium]|nr:permease-like cell division protein FtsX [bacterium]